MELPAPFFLLHPSRASAAAVMRQTVAPAAATGRSSVAPWPLMMISDAGREVPDGCCSSLAVPRFTPKQPRGQVDGREGVRDAPHVSDCLASNLKVRRSAASLAGLRRVLLKATTSTAADSRG